MSVLHGHFMYTKYLIIYLSILSAYCISRLFVLMFKLKTVNFLRCVWRKKNSQKINKIPVNKVSKTATLSVYIYLIQIILANCS
jgi:hypothetical protein